MAYDDEQATRSRVVVDTPTSRREVTHTEAVRNDRGGISGATVGVIVVVAIALVTVVVLFLMNNQNNLNANDNLAAQQQPVVVQQPAPQQQPPVIIQQPAAAPNQPPIIINQPAATGGSAPGNTSNDGAVQMSVDKAIGDDPTLSALGITATVLDGKVTLTGTVKSESLKSQVDKAIRIVRGVKQVDNQIVVMS